MKPTTFTIRDVTTGERNAAGETVLRRLGNVTVTLEGMTRAKVDEWKSAAAALNTRGIDEDLFHLTVNGWEVRHAETGVVGVLLQSGMEPPLHVEWYDTAKADFYYAGQVSRLSHGAAAIINARQHAGQGLPVDVEPEPAKPQAPARPVRLEDGTPVRYHGSLKELSGGTFRVYECMEFAECDRYCDGYALFPVDAWGPVAAHVRLGSVTALETTNPPSTTATAATTATLRSCAPHWTS